MSEQPQDKYVLRLPDGMRDRLKAEAARNGRSMNAEIVQRLERTLDDDDRHLSLSNDLDTMVELESDDELDREFAEAIGKAVRSVIERKGLVRYTAEHPEGVPSKRQARKSRK
jgi:plasmid stability protein